MKKSDFISVSIVLLAIVVFIFVPELMKIYEELNSEHGLIMSFFKFSILATTGEVIALRIRTGKYSRQQFGIIPRAIVWGLIGIVIKAAFVVFSTGVPAFLSYCGLEVTLETVNRAGFTWKKLFTAFSISTFMNLIFAPVFMTFHKITDMHIEKTGGTVRGLFTPISFSEIFPAINWKIQWGFVFKKTIPFFWIPAHTITFLLPPQYRVLFAAALGIVLGVLLAIASLMSEK